MRLASAVRTSSHAFGSPLVHRRSRKVKAPRSLVIVASITSNDIKNGTCIELENTPWKVQEFLHVKPGKGSAFVRCKLRNMRSGTSVEKTFRAGEPLELAAVDKRDCQFTYIEVETRLNGNGSLQGSDYVFMDMDTFEETRLPRDESWAKYLLEGTDCSLLFYNGTVISVDLPQSMDLEVTQTDPGVKGNTAQGGSKSATLSTGVTVQVPLFIETGDIVKVNTSTDEYLSRVGKG